jgi:glutamine amidotransferase
VGQSAVVTRERRVLDDASHVVLPGVGAFGDCMANLERYGLVDPIQRAIGRGKPFLGICLGLQLLFSESEEFGTHKGLGLVPGTVRRFPADGPMAGLKVPHMGWNGVAIQRPAPPLRDLQSGAFFYFVHSYYAEPADHSVISTVTEYGIGFVSSIWRDNVFACQFHPEKSQATGLQVLRNFAEWQP